MSVAVIGYRIISNFAHFAESIGLGPAQEVANIMHNDNLKAYCARYDEKYEYEPCKLEPKINVSDEDMWDDLYFWEINTCYSEWFDTSDFVERAEILRNALFGGPAHESQTFDESNNLFKVGQPVYGKASHYGYKGFVLKDKIYPGQVQIGYVSDETKRFSTINLYHQNVQPEERRKQLTLDQVQYFINRVETRKEAEAKAAATHPKTAFLTRVEFESKDRYSNMNLGLVESKNSFDEGWCVTKERLHSVDPIAHVSIGDWCVTDLYSRKKQKRSISKEGKKNR